MYRTVHQFSLSALGGGEGRGEVGEAAALASLAPSASASGDAMAEAIRDLIGEAPLTPGKVKLELPSIEATESGELVFSWIDDNGQIQSEIRQITVE